MALGKGYTPGDGEGKFVIWNKATFPPDGMVRDGKATIYRCE
jgi:hypothetical protein